VLELACGTGGRGIAHSETPAGLEIPGLALIAAARRP
jgi:hypothetical protein